MIKIISASRTTLVLEGFIRRPNHNWRGRYERVSGSVFCLRQDWRGQGFTECALPHGSACILPQLLGRAILIREEALPFIKEIVPHEMGHYWAWKGRLDVGLSYSENEELADRLALRLQFI